MKERIKVIAAFILGLVLAGTTVYAATIISSINVGYSNESSKLVADNVQEAIDEVYDKSFLKTPIAAYEYSEKEPKCINGEEKTCIKTDCYKKGKTCKQGTVIKYYVKENEYHYFYVLHDDGTNITMQQRENTVRNIPWHEGANDNSKGPDTILSQLEAATSTWVNVNVLEYEPGVTTLYENTNTGCVSTEDYKIKCETNAYTNSVLGARKARARMITAQEASATGCLVWKDGDKDSDVIPPSINAYNQGSCPDFMHNYLYGSKNYGGSYNNNTLNENGVSDHCYWTMSALSTGTTGVWRVGRDGDLNIDYFTTNTNFGARAVVEINKL